MDKFNEVYLNIINECNQKGVVSEGFLKKLGGVFRTKGGKNKMMKEAIVAWMNGNKFRQNGAENKFIGQLPNGYTLKFTFSPSAWNDPKATSIKYAVYLKDEEGGALTLTDNKGVIDYGYTENDIKKELTKKMKIAMTDDEAKSSFTTKKAVDKGKKKAAKEQAEAEAAAAAEAERAEQAEKDKAELSED